MTLRFYKCACATPHLNKISNLTRKIVSTGQFTFDYKVLKRYMIRKIVKQGVNWFSNMQIGYFKDLYEPFLNAPEHILRRISCHRKNHSQASCEYSLTIFLVASTTASTRCLVQNFQLICYSQRVNATSQYNDMVVRDVQNGRTGWDGCSGET